MRELCIVLASSAIPLGLVFIAGAGLFWLGILLWLGLMDFVTRTRLFQFVRAVLAVRAFPTSLSRSRILPMAG